MKPRLTIIAIILFAASPHPRAGDAASADPVGKTVLSDVENCLACHSVKGEGNPAMASALPRNHPAKRQSSRKAQRGSRKFP